jgi:hypothetical protein
LEIFGMTNRLKEEEKREIRRSDGIVNGAIMNSNSGMRRSVWCKRQEQVVKTLGYVMVQYWMIL